MILKALFFDLDDTLLDFKKTELESVSYVLEKCGLKPTKEVTDLYHKINADQWHLLEQGKITRDEVLSRRFILLFKQLKVSTDIFAVQSLYESTLSQSCHVVDGAKEILEKLSGKYRLFIASNGTARVQDGRIELSGLAHYFEKIFISGRLGADKPSPLFFRNALAECENLFPRECVMIGDSLSSDILGGNSVGMKTVFVNSNPSYVKIPAAIPTVSVNSLFEIPDAIGYVEMTAESENYNETRQI